MRKRPINLSFQDTCEIYRMTGVTSFSDGTKTTLYEGECDVQIPMTVRTFKSNDVLLTDHAVYIKKTLENVHSGDLIDYTIHGGNEVKQLTISECYPRTMGTMLILREAKN